MSNNSPYIKRGVSNLISTDAVLAWGRKQEMGEEENWREPTLMNK